jgi:hypothetical protein
MSCEIEGRADAANDGNDRSNVSRPKPSSRRGHDRRLGRISLQARGYPGEWRRLREVVAV